ncbi:MAG: hypothetical protein A2X56_14235 [Nitrospirae bacterium GWC2_57_13]|jgi:hypothetical protein|nr:MAG: hypothetical protein A2072_03015 [Nitrospirae bacterium GWC1_57_7]OGW29239.1 MAG: hypothetical protein A2X56_14235 [Nitrospirae bacterium GWC2_57_13]
MRKALAVLCILVLTLAVGSTVSLAAKPVTAYTLTVASQNPASGVAITVSPLDRNGAGNGTTQFTRSYAANTVVTLTAPATSTGGSFVKWLKGTADHATTAGTTVTMSANTTMTAVYGAAGHAGITGTFTTPAQVTAKCLECHAIQGADAVNSLHGMMPTLSPSVINATGLSQKLKEINTFCSYPNPDMAAAACLTCHPTLGKFQNLTAADIDCLQCHNDSYKRQFTPEPDPAKWTKVVDWQGVSKTYVPAYKNAGGYFQIEFNWAAMPGVTALDLMRNVKKPTTTTCLSCHAKAGGGDWTKRGDMGLNSANPTASQDIHLAATTSGGAGLSCSSCHVPSKHKIPGRGIDLRPTETGVAVKTCEECHPSMATGGGHAALGIRVEPDRHLKRVACQSCHIPAFGKGGATEMWRNWKIPTWNAALCNGQGAWAGEEHKVANVAPDHVFFNGTSYVYALGQTLNRIDPLSGATLMADAVGGINDAVGVSKLVPIKRHQSNMAVMSSGTNIGKVVPFDVTWQFMTGFSDQAAERGKAYAGYTGTHEWKWVEAEMAINHGVSPRAEVAACTNCHHARSNFLITTMSKLDKLGYALKDADKNGVVNAADKAIICSQCHSEKAFKQDWEQMHAHTAKGSGIGCSFCHDIKRPERNLCEPCKPDGTVNTACINEFVDTNYYNHCQ